MTPLHSCTQLEDAHYVTNVVWTGNNDHVNLEFEAHNMIMYLINISALLMHARTQWLKYIDLYLAYFYAACLWSSSGVFDVTGYDDDFNKSAIMFRLKYLHRMLEWYKSPFHWNQAERNEIWHIVFLLPEYQQNQWWQIDWIWVEMFISGCYDFAHVTPFTFI